MPTWSLRVNVVTQYKHDSGYYRHKKALCFYPKKPLTPPTAVCMTKTPVKYLIPTYLLPKRPGD